MMYRYTIKEPYWQYDGISVDLSKCNDPEFEVECSYKDKAGNRYFAGVHKVRRNVVDMMRTVYAKKNKKPLKLIPFEYLKRRESI